MKNEDITNGLKLAKKYDLLISIGSDFHGPNFNTCQVGRGINNTLLNANNTYFDWVSNLK